MIQYAGTPAAARRRRTRSAEEAVSVVRRVDWVLLGSALALVGFGLWAIAGVTRYDVPGDPHHFLTRQAIFAGVGLAGLVAAIFVPPDAYRRGKQLVFGGMLALLVVVILAGAATRGSQRWIDVGMFRFQPSEFGKLLLVLFLAAFLADRGRRIASGATVAAALGLAAVPALLVFVQPDFGTALVYAAATAAVLFVGGVRWLHLAVVAAVGAFVATAAVWLLPAVGIQVLKPYQSARLTAFTDPQSDPSGATYNVNQSITAIGAGGLEGRGVGGATQTNLAYLPEHATDFAFASLAEQRGFVGAAALLGLYLLFLWRGLRVVSVAPDAFSATVAGGIVFALLFQIFINVGMTMGIAPVTGIPLPFVSVGGSSMVVNLVATGVLLAIYARGRARR